MTLSRDEQLNELQYSLIGGEVDRLVAAANKFPNMPVSELVATAKEPGSDLNSMYSKLLRASFVPTPEPRIALTTSNTVIDPNSPDQTNLRREQVDRGLAQGRIPFSPLWTDGTNKEGVISRIEMGDKAKMVADRRAADEASRQENNEDWSDNMFIAPIKGLTRNATAILSMPVEGIMNSVQLGMGLLSGAEDATLDSWANSFSAVAIWRNFDDQGDGWFAPGGMAGEAMEEGQASLYYDKAHEIRTRKKDERGMIIPDSGEKIPVNFGANMNHILSDAIGYDEDSGVGTVVNFVTNVAWYAAADPLNFVPGNALKNIGKSAKGLDKATATAGDLRRLEGTRTEIASMVTNLEEQIFGQKELRAIAEAAGENVDEWGKVIDAMEGSATRGRVKLQAMDEAARFVSEKNKSLGIKPKKGEQPQMDFRWSSDDMQEFADHMDMWWAENNPKQDVLPFNMFEVTPPADASPEFASLWNDVRNARVDADRYTLARERVVNGMTAPELDNARYAQDTYTGATREARFAEYSQQAYDEGQSAIATLDNALVALEGKIPEGRMKALQAKRQRLVQSQTRMRDRAASAQAKTVAKAEKKLTAAQRRAQREHNATRRNLTARFKRFEKEHNTYVDAETKAGDLEYILGSIDQGDVWAKDLSRVVDPGVGIDMNHPAIGRLRERHRSLELRYNEIIDRGGKPSKALKTEMDDLDEVLGILDLGEQVPLSKSRGLRRLKREFDNAEGKRNRLLEEDPQLANKELRDSRLNELNDEIDQLDQQNFSGADFYGNDRYYAGKALQKARRGEARWSDRAFEGSLDEATRLRQNAAAARADIKNLMEQYGLRDGDLLETSPTLDSMKVLTNRAKRAQNEAAANLDEANIGLEALRAEADDLLQKIRGNHALMSKLDLSDKGDTLKQLHDALDQMGGVIRGQGVNDAQFFKTVLGGKWDAVLHLLSKEDSVENIIRMGKGKISQESAVAIADAKSIDEVKHIVMRDFGLGQDGISGKIRSNRIRAGVAAARQQKATHTTLARLKARGYNAAAKLEEYTGAKVPWAHVANLSDGEASAKAFRDYLSYVYKGKNKDKQIAHMDALHRATSIEERRTVMARALYDLSDEAVEGADDVYREAVQQAVEGALKRSREDAMDGIENAMDAAARGVDPDAPVIADFSAVADSFILPNVRDFKHLVKKGQQLHERGASKVSAEYLMNVVDNTFRTAMLVNPRYILRNLIEGQTRMFMNGDSLENPASFIARVFGGSRFNVDMTGKRWGEVSIHNMDLSTTSKADRMIMSVIARGHSSIDPNTQPRFAYMGRNSVQRGKPEFAMSMAGRMSEMRSSQLYDDVMQVLNGTIPQHIEDIKVAKGFDNYQDAVVEFYTNQGGRKVFEELGATNDDIRRMIDSPEASDWVKEQLFGDAPNSVEKELRDLLGMDGNFDQGLVDIYNMLNTKQGKLKSVFRPEDAAKELRKRMRKNQYVPDEIHNAPVMARRGFGGANAEKGLGQTFIDKFFDFAGRTEDVTMWQPKAQQVYWQKVVELAKHGDETARKMISENGAKALGKDTVFSRAGRLRRDLDFNLKQDAGPLTFEEIHGMAARAANDETRRLFYDAFEKKQYWQAVRLVAPFGQAWSNTNATIAKLSTDARTWRQLHKISLAQRAAEGPEHWTEEEWSENWRQVMADPLRRPTIYAHPMYGTKMMDVPIMGDVMSWAAGGEGLLDVSTPVNSLSPATQNPMSPGLGPLFSGPIQTLNNFDWYREMPSFMKEAIEPFPSGSEGVAVDTLDGFIPAWARRFGQLIGISGQDEVDAATGYIANYLIATRPEEYQVNEAGQVGDPAKLAADAQSMARQQTWTRGLITAGFAGTAQMNWKMKTQDMETPTWQIMAQDHYHRMLEDNLGDQNLAMKEFTQVYGPNAYWSVMGKTDTNGIPQTNEVAEFMSQNPGLLEKYPDVAGLFFSYDPSVTPLAFHDQEASMLLKAENMKDFKTVDEMVERGNKTLYMFNTAWTRDLEDQGVPSTVVAPLKRAFETEEGLFEPTWDIGGFTIRDQQMDKALETEMGNTPAADGIKAYKQYRDVMREAMGGSLEGDTGKVARDQLAQLGKSLAIDDPTFKRAWNGLYRDEVNGDWVP